MDSYQEFIATRTYTRWLEEEGRRETFKEAINRYKEFFFTRIPTEKISEFVDATDMISDLEVMPSMRCLWAAGDALERENISGFNCAFVTVDDYRAFAEILYVLMNGTGVGFSTERQEVAKLPKVPSDLSKSSSANIVFEDSKLGWAEGFLSLLDSLYAGLIPDHIDYTKIRPEGARLKTFGGRASGPIPLVQLCDFTIDLFVNSEGSHLSSIECYDLVCFIANCVVVGGVRRSATINLSNLSDDKMRHAKDGQFYNKYPYRALSNNSVAYTEKPSTTIFMEEWMSLIKGGSGERGVVNREAMAKKCDYLGREYQDTMGVNPCFHPNTVVETVNGPVMIKDMTEPTKVYSMTESGKLCIKQATASWVTRKDAGVTKINYTNGSLVVTPEHRVWVLDKGWVKAQDLVVGDKLNPLVRHRRGAKYCGIKLGSEKRSETQMEHRLVYQGVYGDLIEDYDVHHIDGDTYNNTIDNLEAMLHSEHATLTRNSCANDHQVRGSNGEFISGKDSKHGSKTIVHLPDHLKAGLHQYCTVLSTEDFGSSDVYDVTVEDTHCLIANGVVAHNCGEIILRSKQFCNLSEIVVRDGDTLEDLKPKAKAAVIFGMLQSTLTDFNFLRDEWITNTKDEGLLGVSLTGVCDNSTLTAFDYANLREYCWLVAEEWSKVLCIDMPAAITCVKPSGTVSQLVNSASGLHPRYSEYYIRRVRVNGTDPIAEYLIYKGVNWDAEVGQTLDNHTTKVFDFPVKSPKCALLRENMTAIEQLNHWRMLNDSWCDHNPSCTIYVRDSEWLAVGNWVYENWDDICGLSFLPYDGGNYPLAPYEEVTEEEYFRLVSEFPKDIDFSSGLRDFEVKDTTQGSSEFACSGGSCELI